MIFIIDSMEKYEPNIDFVEESIYTPDEVRAIVEACGMQLTGYGRTGPDFEIDQREVVSLGSVVQVADHLTAISKHLDKLGRWPRPALLSLSDAVRLAAARSTSYSKVLDPIRARLAELLPEACKTCGTNPCKDTCVTHLQRQVENLRKQLDPLDTAGALRTLHGMMQYLNHQNVPLSWSRSWKISYGALTRLVRLRTGDVFVLLDEIIDRRTLLGLPIEFAKESDFKVELVCNELVSRGHDALLPMPWTGELPSV